MNAACCGRRIALAKTLLGEAHLLLLFLKTLSAIEVGDWLVQVSRPMDQGDLEV